MKNKMIKVLKKISTNKKAVMAIRFIKPMNSNTTRRECASIIP